MTLKIRNVDINYDESNNVSGVNIRFDFSDNVSNLNGFLRLTEEEYNSNSSTMDTLSAFVKTKITSKINA